MNYCSKRPGSLPVVRLGALVAVTAACLLAIVAFGEGRKLQASSPGVTHTAAPLTIIYTRERGLESLSRFIAQQGQVTESAPAIEKSITVARLSLDMYLASGNTRFLGAAKSATAPWEDVAQPPPEIWRLRARLLQTDHRFEAAARDLALFNRFHSGSPEALLLEADAWRRAGLIANSKKACMRLAVAGRMDLAKFCAAEILLSLGDANSARALLENTITHSAAFPPAEKRWALAIYADVLSAIGEPEQAAAYWAIAVEADDTPLAYKLSYADVLLSLSRYEDVAELLNDHAQATASLLRLAVAAHHMGDSRAAAMQSALEHRLELGRKVSLPDLHLREEALLALWLEHDAEKSLQLALRNWELQKGWEDAALVLTIADQLNNTAAIERIRAWQQLNAASGTSSS